MKLELTQKNIDLSIFNEARLFYNIKRKGLYVYSFTINNKVKDIKTLRNQKNDIIKLLDNCDYFYNIEHTTNQTSETNKYYPHIHGFLIYDNQIIDSKNSIKPIYNNMFYNDDNKASSKSFCYLTEITTAASLRNYYSYSIKNTQHEYQKLEIDKKSQGGYLNISDDLLFCFDEKIFV